ncbi:MAG: lipoyl synthase [Nitrospinota bacterium]
MTDQSGVHPPHRLEYRRPLDVKAARSLRTLPPRRRPAWLKVRMPGGPNYRRLKDLMRTQRLHTVCEEARCPNVGECWEAGTATFLILGSTCTRRCSFCAITTGRPDGLDRAEPRRVAESVVAMGLRFAVLTSVARDDLPDGGASIFAQTIREIHRAAPECGVEVLIPDFKGDAQALRTVVEAAPDVINHNVETVARLQRAVRPQAKYGRSLEVIRRVKAWANGATFTKSGLMLGLGERLEEIYATLEDLVAAGCDLLTVGQYLAPSADHPPVATYYPPEVFEAIGERARALGFLHVESGPLVRSSYHAERQIDPRLFRREGPPSAAPPSLRGLNEHPR